MVDLDILNLTMGRGTLDHLQLSHLQDLIMAARTGARKLRRVFFVFMIFGVIIV